MITNFLVALMMFFGVSFGQVDNSNSKGKSNNEPASKTIIIDDLGGN